jgi:hypothetical protein
MIPSSACPPWPADIPSGQAGIRRGWQRATPRYGTRSDGFHGRFHCGAFPVERLLLRHSARLGVTAGREKERYRIPVKHLYLPAFLKSSTSLAIGPKSFHNRFSSN